MKSWSPPVIMLVMGLIGVTLVSLVALAFSRGMGNQASSDLNTQSAGYISMQGDYIAPTVLPTAANTASVDSAATLSAIQKRIGGPSTTPELWGHPVEWLVTKTTFIPLKAYEFSLSIGGPSQFGTVTNIELLTKDYLTAIGTTLTNAFVAEGFAKDPTNTLDDFGLISKNYGFIKGEEKCVVKLYAMTDPYGSVSCGVYDAQQAEWQALFSPVIESSPSPDTVITVQKVEGNYALGGIGSRIGGGAFWIAVKEDGVWKKVFDGQDSPDCALTEKYKIPTSIIECYPVQ